MWKFFRKLGLGTKPVQQSSPVTQQQTKASINSANRAAGREALGKLIPIMGSDASIPMMEQLVLHSDVYVRADAKHAAAEAVGSDKATESFRSAFWEVLITSRT